MRFGAFVPQGWRLDLAGIPVDKQWSVMLDVARGIEVAGYESLWVYDHFHTVPVPTDEPTYEAWTLMASLAATTATVRLGQMCTCNGYRSPSYLAKVAASIDAISGGRVEMGIGAGWYEEEFLGYGYEFPSGATRIAQLGEGVEIMRRMWTEDKVDFEGEHYQLQGGICRPRPLQQPTIPFWIAGGGEKLTLRLAARHASYTNFGVTIEEFRRKSEVLAGHCRDVGRDPAEVVRSSNFNVLIAPTTAEVEGRVRWLENHMGSQLPEEQVARHLAMYRHEGLIGTPDDVVQRLGEWATAGLEYAICYFPEAAYDPSGFELFAREVVPALP